MGRWWRSTRDFVWGKKPIQCIVGLENTELQKQFSWATDYDTALCARYIFCDVVYVKENLEQFNK